QPLGILRQPRDIAIAGSGRVRPGRACGIAQDRPYARCPHCAAVSRFSLGSGRGRNLGDARSMSPEVIRGASPSGIDIAYERFGDRDAPPVLLVMGLATQMLGWPEEFCSALVARGLHVIRFDNRDVGLSTHLHDARQPDVMAALSGDSSSASYTLSDMAGDSVGLLDALELDSAHIVGASMGGMIAQTVAIEHPDPVRSLTSIMSTTGDAAVGQASGGRATADAIPEAELVIFDGMGHDLPRALWSEITARIGDVVQRAEARARAQG